jgi:hypothetical protein
MTTVPAATEPVDQLLERVVILGDLSKLTTGDRNRYYARVCRDLGLSPSTQPFAYLTLQGKTVLYATKGCTDQLRAIHKISIEIIARELVDGIYTVRARSLDPSGRHDEDEGIVPLPDNVKGEFRSNLMMKATTKAKRRVTLSHCGLGMLDESEIDSIRDAKIEPAPSPEQLTLAEEMQDQIPDELHADASQPTAVTTSVAAGAQETTSPPASAALSLEQRFRNAAQDGGHAGIEMFLSKCTDKEKRQLSKTFGIGKEDVRVLYPQPGRE